MLLCRYNKRDSYYFLREPKVGYGYFNSILNIGEDQVYGKEMWMATSVYFNIFQLYIIDLACNFIISIKIVSLC